MAEWKRKLEATDAADDAADQQKGEKEQDSARDLGAAPSARRARAHIHTHTHTHRQHARARSIHAAHACTSTRLTHSIGATAAADHSILTRLNRKP
jgi:hypothetical protein